MTRKIYYHKFLPDILEKIYEAIEMGLTKTLAASYAGVSRDSMRAWRLKGEQDIENDIDSPFAEFVHRMEMARARRAAKWLKNISLAGQNQWQANAWLLERTERDSFGLNNVEESHEHEDKKGHATLEERVDRIAQLLETARTRSAD